MVTASIGPWSLVAFLTAFVDDPTFNDPWTHRLLRHIWAYPAYVLAGIIIGCSLRLAKREFRGACALVAFPLLVFLVLAVAFGVLGGRYRDADGLTPAQQEFLLGCEVGDVAELEKHLRDGLDPNLRSHRGRTPLGVAYEANETSAVHLLLEHGADPNALSRYGLQLLGEPELLEVLLTHGFDPDQLVLGRPYLHEAIRRGHTEAVTLLMEHGAAPSRGGGEGHALVLAVTLGRWEAAMSVARRSSQQSLSAARDYLRAQPASSADPRSEVVVVFIDEQLVAMTDSVAEAVDASDTMTAPTASALQAAGSQIQRVEVSDTVTGEALGVLDTHTLELLRAAIIRGRVTYALTTTPPPWEVSLRLQMPGDAFILAHLVRSTRLRVSPEPLEQHRDRRAAEIEIDPTLFDALEVMLGPPSTEYVAASDDLRTPR